MNAKTFKFYELFEGFVKLDAAADKMGLSKAFRNFMELDYALASDVWDYAILTREERLVKDERLAEVFGFEVLNQFYAFSSQKCIKSICDTPAIRRAIYQYSKNAGTESALKIFTDLLVTNKLVPAEEVLKCLAKNERIHYGKTLEIVLKRVFIELLSKNPAKISMSKKLYELLLVYVRKIKTDERAVLEQRIKETQ
ncbi:MAG: hypothetical protein FWH03_01535 [Firmicutes bacterium]|nr:hypothetical protein [Bacillota bacterium]